MPLITTIAEDISRTAQNSWYGIPNPWSSDFTTFDGAQTQFIAIINALISVSGLIAVGMLIYGAFTLISAVGDPEKIEKGQKMITGAIVGLVIIILSRMVILFVYTNVLGL